MAAWGCSRTATRGAQNEAGVGMPGDGFEDLVRLLYSESGILFQKSRSVTQCNIERSNRLRNAVQRCIQSDPLCYRAIRISCACFVKSATSPIVAAHDTPDADGAAQLPIIGI